MCLRKKCVRKCCCCINLKVGGYIITVVGLLQNVIFIYRGKVLLYFGSAATIYGLFVTPFFLWGIYSKERRFMVPFILGTILWLVIALFNLVLFATHPVGKFKVDEDEYNTFRTDTEKLVFCIIAIVEIIVWMYYYIIIQSLYIDLKREKLVILSRSALVLDHNI